MYKGDYYLQVPGVTMGSQVSLIVYNFVEANEPRAGGKIYVYDKSTVLKKDQAQAFTDYLNVINDDIRLEMK